jgi:hypothetical protein
MDTATYVNDDKCSDKVFYPVETVATHAIFGQYLHLQALIGNGIEPFGQSYLLLIDPSYIDNARLTHLESIRLAGRDIQLARTLWRLSR